ncbi:NAD-dependent DNA ligase LigA [Streptomyces sp. NPDC059193]|uniref:NAD-dependent DNA ligase LigA n=1 Tax=Streptomyces sp. NPDC059193 TaxID=3346763 RepID=UPI00369DE03A
MTTLPPVDAVASPAAYQAALHRLSEASQAYYGGDDTLLDDATYDRLRAAVLDWEAQHPEDSTDSPTGLVADGAAPVGDVEHTTRLLSLDNVFNAEGLVDWGVSLQRRLGDAPVGGFTVEPKIDGAAVAARYRDGRLTQIITRGDGSHGEDISHVIGQIDGLPEILPVPVTVEVRGEVVFTTAQFQTANDVRTAHGAQVFANPRNGAAGTLRAKDRPYRLQLTFWAYGAVELDGQPFTVPGATHAETLAAVTGAGVQTTAATAAGLHVVADLAEAQQKVDEIHELRERLPFGIDGVVIKVNGAGEQAAAGFGSRFPHWAIAFKLPAVERQTVLEDVVWEVGRTGVLAPTAVLTPVEIDGSLVSRATLHNPADIRRRDLHISDTVTVYKAGDIIPRVQAAVVALRPVGAVEVPLPEQCPNCGGPIDRRQERWRCEKGAACALPALIEYAAEREKLDIDGLGKTYVKALVESGDVADVADLFTLTTDQLTAASGSAKRAVKLAEQIAAAKTRPLSRVLCALGILGTGRSISRRIAQHFGSMEAVRQADATAMQAVEGIGTEKAPVIVEQVAALAPVIDKLIAAGVNMLEPQAASQAQGERPLSGMVVVVTGKMTGPLTNWGRPEMNALIERAGGRAGSSVSAKTSLLVAAPSEGGKPSVKAVKAAELGVEVMSPEAFAGRVSDFLN